MNSDDIERWLRWELDGHSAFKQRAVDDTVKYVKELEDSIRVWTSEAVLKVNRINELESLLRIERKQHELR